MSNHYRCRIRANEVEESAAMDVAGYSRLTPESRGTRFVIFTAQNKVQAQANVKAALGGLFRQGLHQVTNS